MAESVVTQISRESPEIEARKIALLNAAMQLGQQPLTLPPQMVAGFTPDQLAAFQMTRAGVGGYQPYLQQARLGTQEAVAAQRAGIEALTPADFRESLVAARGARPISFEARDIVRGSQFDPTQAALGLREAREQALGTQPTFGEAQDIVRGTQFDPTQAAAGFREARQTAGGIAGLYDPSMAQGFYDPFEERVVQQTLADVREGLAKSDVQRRAQALQSGAFGGSRSRLLGEEQREAAARGAAEQVGAIRSAGFQRAQQQAQQAFEQEKARRGQLAGLQSQLAGQEQQLGLAGLQAQLQRAQALSGMGQAQQQQRLAQAGLLGDIAGQYQQLGLAGLQSQLQRAQALSGFEQAQQQQRLAQAGLLGDIAQRQAAAGLARGQAIGQMGMGIGSLAQQQAGLGQLGQQLVGQDIERLARIGGMGQQQQQNIFEAARQSQLQQMYEPYQRLGFVSDIYRGAPSTQQAITMQSQPGASPFQQVAGLGIAGLGAYGAGRQMFG